MPPSTLPADAQHCPALKKNGVVCGAKVGPSGYCIGHSPQAQAARAKGGSGRSREAQALKALPARLRPVANLLTSALVEVRQGTLDPRRASAMASLAGALVRVIQAGELEERVQELEAMQHAQEAAQAVNKPRPLKRA